MAEADIIAQDYIRTWNEHDATARQALLSERWAADASYADPLMQGRGHAEIDALIAGVQARFPDFRFDLIGQPDGNGRHVRFSWRLGPAASDSVVEGTDFVTLAGERIGAVAGFLDKVPA